MNNDDISINDFNTQLNELLCLPESPDSEDRCLISNDILEKGHIKLICSHKFNYNSIYKEVKNQKHPSHLETQKLSRSQLKCPYCRKIQQGLLPYRENYPKIHGVNWPPKYHYLPNNCKYAFVSGKKKNIQCNKSCAEEYCINHAKIIHKRLLRAKKAEQLKEKVSQTNIIMNTGLQTHLFGDPFDPLSLPPLQIPPPNLPPTGCTYIFKKGKKKNSKCTCQKTYAEFLGPTSVWNGPLCKSHYNQLKKKQTKMLAQSVSKSWYSNLINKYTHITPIALGTAASPATTTASDEIFVNV